MESVPLTPFCRGKFAGSGWWERRGAPSCQAGLRTN